MFEAFEIGEIVGVYVKDFNGRYDPIKAEIVDYKKSFFREELYKVQWEVKNSWDGEPPFWYSRESKWLPAYKIMKLGEK